MVGVQIIASEWERVAIPEVGTDRVILPVQRPELSSRLSTQCHRKVGAGGRGLKAEWTRTVWMWGSGGCHA